MLMDEQPDLGLGDISIGDISTLSFGSPVKTDSVPSSFDIGDDAEANPVGVDDSLIDAEDEGEETIVLPKTPLVSSPPAELAPSSPPIVNAEAPTPARQPKLRITSETERIVVSDIMMLESDPDRNCSHCRARYGLRWARSLCPDTRSMRPELQVPVSHHGRKKPLPTFSPSLPNFHPQLLHRPPRFPQYPQRPTHPRQASRRHNKF